VNLAQVHPVHLRGWSWFIRRDFGQTHITGRTIDGFAAGALVITNPNPTLEAFGFLPNVHFFPLWDENVPAEEISFPPDEDMERMAEAGHALLTAIVNNGGFPLSASPRDLGIAS
jgi:hypothetical protein